MRILAIYCMMLCLVTRAQQTITYTQYLFNKAGMNPAAAGTDINQKYVYMFGANRQWMSFDNSPKATFVNFSYTLRPPRSYHYWQNAGIYIDDEQSGLMGNTGIYVNYTLHLLVRRKLVASFGVYAGIRKYERNLGSFTNDPAFEKSPYSLYLYPDVIPGFRLSGKKFFTDLSIRQVSIPELKDFKGRRFGKHSKLHPSIYYDYGQKIPLADQLLMIPSVAVNFPIIAPPSVDVSTMFYYATRVGAGVAIRNASFASAILQIRFLENVTAGFAYSYPINASRYAAPNSFEVMVGVTPVGLNSKAVGKHSVAKCPTLEY